MLDDRGGNKLGLNLEDPSSLSSQPCDHIAMHKGGMPQAGQGVQEWKLAVLPSVFLLKHNQDLSAQGGMQWARKGSEIVLRARQQLVMPCAYGVGISMETIARCYVPDDVDGTYCWV